MFNISVVVPTFNRETFILDALSSIAMQSYQPVEVIVVDDGSTDRTRQLVEEKFGQIRYFRSANRGVSSARNIGINAAQGNAVAFLDSDDLWHPDKLKHQILFFEKNTNCRVVHTNEDWYKNGRLLAQKKHHKKSGGDIFYDSLLRCVISPSSVLIKKDLLNEVGFFNEALPACEDYDLWLRITSFEKVGFVDRPLVTKRGGHKDQLSRCVEGLDQYRIESLIGIIRDGRLRQDKKEAAKREAIRKIRIYRGGASKRCRHTVVRKLDQLLCEIHSA